MTTTTAPDQVVRLLATNDYDVHRLVYEALLCPPRRCGVLVRRPGRESAAGSASMQPATNRP